MARHDHFLTPAENIALELVFAQLGESRFNRSMADYMAIASRAPKVTAMHHDVNEILGHMAQNGIAPYQICDFQAGDRSHWYRPFPTELSLETIRNAWVKSGMRALQLESKRHRKAPKLTH